MRHVEPDPSREYFDVVDVDGNLTGVMKRRDEVHRDGDWHRAFHLWVVARAEPDGAPAVIFQRRARTKDTYPDLLDVTVGGHYRAGEGFDDVVREIEEEIGIAPPNGDLIEIGRRWAEGIYDAVKDREIEDVYVFALDRPVADLRPSYEEITALDVIRVVDIESLLVQGERSVPSVRYHVRPDNSLEPPEHVVVTASDFIPVTDGYWVHGTRAAAAVLNGKADVRLELRRYG
jgi:isopentenyldiphosphate isomerase